MNELHIILVLITGIAAGFLNTVAGGGSLLAMPILIFTGLSSAVANGTNRIAIMVQNIIAVTNFKNKGYFYPKLGLMFTIPAIIGSIIGAKFAILISEEAFKKILATIMVIVLVLIVLRPEKKISNFIQDERDLGKKRVVLAVIAFFFVGFYGGFIQAGVGFIIIVTLSLITGLSLVKINVFKVFIVGIYTISSLIVFIVNGKVNWILGLALAVGNGLGAYIGSNFALNKGDQWIRRILIIVVLAMAIKLLLF